MVAGGKTAFSSKSQNFLVNLRFDLFSSFLPLFNTRSYYRNIRFLLIQIKYSAYCLICLLVRFVYFFFYHSLLAWHGLLATLTLILYECQMVMTGPLGNSIILNSLLVSIKSSTSILMEPIIATAVAKADPLRSTHIKQYPIASVAPSFAVSSTLTSTCSDLCHFYQKAMHQTPVDNYYAATASGLGYVGPRHNTACTDLTASTSSAQKKSEGKSTSDSYTKGKSPLVVIKDDSRSRGEQPPGSSSSFDTYTNLSILRNFNDIFRCHWKDCTYRSPFSGKPASMRHIDTHHISPCSFDCPSIEWTTCPST